MRYRRSQVGGGSYFFTANIENRNDTLLVDYIDVLRESVRLVKRRYPFQIDAMVVLPDHLHTIWTLPPGDSNYPLRWFLIKSSFSRCIPKTEDRNASRVNKGERGIWQRRYWEHQIRDERDLSTHVDYIHYNPVKHGYVQQAIDWPYSSIHRFVRKGILPANWGSTEQGVWKGDFGEG